MKNCERVKVVHIFNSIAGKTIFDCIWDQNCAVTFPSYWQLFCDEKFICEIQLDGYAMANYRKGDTIIFWKYGHLEMTGLGQNLELRRIT